MYKNNFWVKCNRNYDNVLNLFYGYKNLWKKVEFGKKKSKLLGLIITSGIFCFSFVFISFWEIIGFRLRSNSHKLNRSLF